MRTSVVLVGGL